VKITRDVMDMVRQSRSIAEMRQAVDEKYGVLGEGTNTPDPRDVHGPWDTRSLSQESVEHKGERDEPL